MAHDASAVDLALVDRIQYSRVQHLADRDVSLEAHVSQEGDDAGIPPRDRPLGARQPEEVRSRGGFNDRRLQAEEGLVVSHARPRSDRCDNDER